MAEQAVLAVEQEIVQQVEVLHHHRGKETMVEHQPHHQIKAQEVGAVELVLLV
jgi:hypothetical protein